MARPGQIAILAALPWEVRPFLGRVRARRRRGLGLPAWEFALGQVTGVAALTGMVPAAARDAARHLLARVQPETLISVGFGGALTPALAPGALVLGKTVWRWEPGRAYLSPAVAPAPPRPLTELLEALKTAGYGAAAGSLVTTPGIIRKQGLGAALLDLESPVLDLESALLAGVAASEGLAFLGLRAVTDGAGEEIPDFIVQAGGEVGPGAALRWLAGDIRRAGTLFRLWRRSRLAAARLAGALLVLLPLLAPGGQKLQNQPG